MALQPNSLSAQERLQPGARGEIFQANLPGHRDGADRINRTQNFMNVSQHDVPNIKYEFDYRLPVLFKYGFDFGFNQVVVPKGRLVAADPHMDLVDFESQKQFNTLTLANGGVPVRLRKTGDLYKNSGGSATALVSSEAQGKELHNIGKDWTPVRGMEEAYADGCYRPFAKAVAESGVVAEFYGAAAQLSDAKYSVSAETGKIIADGEEVADVRPGNVPLGVIQRNEYTRDSDAFNGIMPGPILTDSMIELPWFAYKDKAEQNPWGSAYGVFKVGDLVKSDENGRFTLSPLSSEAAIASMTPAEIEIERQQVVGQIYSTNKELIPEGAARWAEWALEDKLNFEGFTPALYKQNGRRGEDAVNSSPFNSKGEYPGYPYDKNYLNHDLHMLASTGRGDNYDPRMNFEYRYSDMGIPGLTDGYNAVKKEISDQKVGMIHHAGDKEYVEMFFRTIDLGQFIEVGSLQIKVGAGSSYAPLVKDAKIACNGTAGIFNVKYVSELQGIFVLEVVDKATADTALEAAGGSVEVFVKYERRGESGVPTFMDWDGICGSVKILFQK